MYLRAQWAQYMIQDKCLDSKAAQGRAMKI